MDELALAEAAADLATLMARLASLALDLRFPWSASRLGLSGWQPEGQGVRIPLGPPLKVLLRGHLFEYDGKLDHIGADIMPRLIRKDLVGSTLPSALSISVSHLINTDAGLLWRPRRLR